MLTTLIHIMMTFLSDYNNCNNIKYNNDEPNTSQIHSIDNIEVKEKYNKQPEDNHIKAERNNTQCAEEIDYKKIYYEYLSKRLDIANPDDLKNLCLCIKMRKTIRNVRHNLETVFTSYKHNFYSNITIIRDTLKTVLINTSNFVVDSLNKIKINKFSRMIRARKNRKRVEIVIKQVIHVYYMGVNNEIENTCSRCIEKRYVNNLKRYYTKRIVNKFHIIKIIKSKSTDENLVENICKYLGGKFCRNGKIYRSITNNDIQMNQHNNCCEIQTIRMCDFNKKSIINMNQSDKQLNKNSEILTEDRENINTENSDKSSKIKNKEKLVENNNLTNHLKSLFSNTIKLIAYLVTPVLEDIEESFILFREDVTYCRDQFWKQIEKYDEYQKLPNPLLETLKKNTNDLQTSIANIPSSISALKNKLFIKIYSIKSLLYEEIIETIKTVKCVLHYINYHFYIIPKKILTNVIYHSFNICKESSYHSIKCIVNIFRGAYYIMKKYTYNICVLTIPKYYYLLIDYFISRYMNLCTTINAFKQVNENTKIIICLGNYTAVLKKLSMELDNIKEQTTVFITGYWIETKSDVLLFYMIKILHDVINRILYLSEVFIYNFNDGGNGYVLLLYAFTSAVDCGFLLDRFL
ncbi:hypothetical protein SLOPH_784 [Spraguea lophii 42_110]|uniref:Uncharacterized protein n=1 Tax=Spraguea lophii (strain 42_110) TaxID=1358809 RepID=S7W9C1_SPRLO|nr:hypothetical protein SLOPH_784 [Spraguea lophii 42_110]